MDNLKEWIEEVLNDNGCHLYELEWITNQGTPLLRVSVEKEDGTMDLDTCATCSDAIGTMLDEKTGMPKNTCLKFVRQERKESFVRMKKFKEQLANMFLSK